MKKIAITQGELTGVALEILIKISKIKNIAEKITIIAGKDGFQLLKQHISSKYCNLLKVDYTNIPQNIQKNDALASIYYAARQTEQGIYKAVVTSPVDKYKISTDYPNFTGHTGFLKEIFNAQNTLMLMSTNNANIGILTEHIALHQVSNAITKKKIISATQLLNQHIQNNTSLKNKPIAILGLNPHASDNSLISDEEEKTITPAILELQKQGINAIGPIPADTTFMHSKLAKYGAILTMYHDQGMIPAKLLGFDNLVNITLGLPITRTSPGHGVAYDIVGKNIVSIEPTLSAIKETY